MIVRGSSTTQVQLIVGWGIGKKGARSERRTSGCQVTNEQSRGHEATDGRTIKLREEIAAGYLGEGGSSLTGY